jgi:hypothetical protein
MRITLNIFYIVIFMHINLSDAISREWFREHKVVAVYIYNLLNYTDFPSSEKKICVYKSKEIAEILEEIGASKNFSVDVITRGKDDISSCSMIYVANNNDPNTKQLIKKSLNKPILTVGMDKGFAKNHGIVGFYEENDRLKIETNLKRAKESGLRIGAELLEISRVIK